MDTSAPTRKPRGFKIALIIVAGLLLAFVCFLYFLPSFLPIGTIKGIAAGKARELAGLDLDFKTLGFSWNGSAVVGGITIAPVAPEGETAEPLLTVDEVRANVALLPLLSGKIVVNGVDVDGFAARVVRDPDGNLNLPDFSALQASIPPERPTPGRPRLRLSALAADGAPAQLPPIELHRLDLKNGVLTFLDGANNMEVDLGVDFVHVEGGALDDPFVLAGRLLPYPGKPDQGEFPFTGRIAMVKNGALDLDGGEAALQVEVNSFALQEFAAKLGLGNLVRAGNVDGVVKAGYAEKKALLSVNDFRVAGADLGLGGQLVLNLPDTVAGLEVEFDPEPGTVKVSAMNLTNDILNVRGSGWSEGVYGLASGKAPVGAIDFNGNIDFAKASGYLSDQNLAPGELPELQGAAAFTGKAVLGEQTAPGDPLAPTLTLDVTEGTLSARHPATGIAASVGLAGIDVRGAASLGDSFALNAAVNLANVALSAIVPQLGSDPVTVAVSGGVAANLAGDEMDGELRLKDTAVQVPATPWSQALRVVNPETRLTYNLKNDTLDIQAISFTVNNSVQGGVSAARVTGIAAGNPQGQMDIALSALLEQAIAIVRPIIPDFAKELAGSLRASTRVRVDGGAIEALTRAELDNAQVTLDLPAGVARIESPKTALDLSAGTALANPLAVTLRSLAVDNGGSVLQFSERGGLSASGRLGEAMVRMAGAVDPSDLRATFSTISLTLNGLAVALGQGGEQTAGLSSGIMQLVFASPENNLVFPISGQGDFSFPSIDAGADNFVFYRLNAGNREDSDFGSVRAKLALDGYLGGEKAQVVNLNIASLRMKPMAADLRGRVDLGSGALAAAYAANVAPAGLTSLLSFLKLPPALLTGATVRGSLSWNGTQVESKANVQGQLRLSSGEVSPFEMNHDVAAAFMPAEKSLAIQVKQLDGAVKTAAGEAVATLKAEPSNLLLSRAGSKGFIDIRVQGAAGPTRILALGLAGVFPQLADYSNTLYNMQAEGVYSGWLQIRDKDSSAIALNLGGAWQGAALQINNKPLLAEPGRLSAALEGEFAYRDNRVDVTRLYMGSESIRMQADGKAQVLLAVDQDQSITGVSNVNVDLTFGVPDLSLVSRVFPGAVPADLGVTGAVTGAFKAGGDAHDIRVGEGAVRFQNFRFQRGSTEVTIPNGAANFGAAIALQLNNAQSAGASPFGFMRLFNVSDGQASLVGAQFKGKPIEQMATAFQLRDGSLAFGPAQVVLGGQDGGAVSASGTVDFNQPAPAVDMRLAIVNFPLAEVNEEMKDFLEFQQGVLNLPAAQGQTAGVAFAGFSEDEILQTLRLDGFTFATGAVTIRTGPVLNEQLDRARAIMKQQTDGQARIITLQSINGAAEATGQGFIHFTPNAPINVIGDNTGDFRVTGTVNADHTIDLQFFVVGKLENLIGFTLPNLIPNLRSGTDEDRNRFMARMNENAAAGHYRVMVRGPLDRPSLDGIPDLALRFMADIVKAAPTQIIGGLVELGKDAPTALLEAGGAVGGALLNAPETIVNAPRTIINAPGNLGRGLGRAFGLGGGGNGESQEGGEQTQDQEGETQEHERRGLRLPFGR